MYKQTTILHKIHSNALPLRKLALDDSGTL